ncbi:hypothetical protein E1B28_002010 [Marasmius oreades]|uniref:Transcription factor domain-containing protein n=1 Tax=Marasmius oreades TaxID=181124 RepID=A0A9P7V4J7_9AGAR|nr:uncharacterized protein E1B28_002010 [Marasmius oreades]KAG7100236.1 hypothetical protein E1B28_002010 [Marasmius oreades]
MYKDLLELEKHGKQNKGCLLHAMSGDPVRTVGMEPRFSLFQDPALTDLDDSDFWKNRRLKIRCDEARPICGQCTRRAHLLQGEECEYADFSGRTESEVLQERIYGLEARIRDLEAPKPERGSLRLFQPYPEGQDRGQSSQVTEASSNSLEHIHASTPLVPTQLPELSLERHQSLLKSVLSQSFNLGFFLNPTRFWDTAPGHPSDSLTPGLLGTIYVLGSHLQSSASESELESESGEQRPSQLQLQLQLQHSLPRSLSEVPTMLNSTHPHRTVHSIQAEVLLSTYFFDTGRMVEGMYHLNQAVSVVIGAGLDRHRGGVGSRSAVTSNPHSHQGIGIGIGMSPPRQAIEEGERINAFWMVYMLSNVWGAMVGSYAFEGIGTPWGQFDLTDYEQVLYGVHALALCAESSILLNRAATLTSSFDSSPSLSLPSVYTNLGSFDPPDLSDTEKRQFFDSFKALDNLIDSFITSRLPPTAMDGVDRNADPTSQGFSGFGFSVVLLTHTIAYTSCIQLHSLFIHTDPQSLAKSLVSAKASVQLLRQGQASSNGGNGNVRSSAFVVPILGMLWTSIGMVFLKEIEFSRLRRRGGGDVDREGEMMLDLEWLLKTMRGFSGRSVLMRNQYTLLQEALKQLT